jgi:probable rRNA maturation factor
MASKLRQPKASRVPRHAPIIENRQKRIRLPLSELRRFLLRINAELGLGPEAAFVRFITDAEMSRLNHAFRKKAKTTDVLSFPSESRTRPRSLPLRSRQLRRSFLGDIAISPTVARRNAQSFGRTLPEEICVLMLHGVLHLLGYDHVTDRGEMERVEAMLRRRLGLS